MPQKLSRSWSIVKYNDLRTCSLWRHIPQRSSGMWDFTSLREAATFWNTVILCTLRFSLHIPQNPSRSWNMVKYSDFTLFAFMEAHGPKPSRSWNTMKHNDFAHLKSLAPCTAEVFGTWRHCEINDLAFLKSLGVMYFTKIQGSWNNVKYNDFMYFTLSVTAEASQKLEHFEIQWFYSLRISGNICSKNVWGAGAL